VSEFPELVIELGEGVGAGLSVEPILQCLVEPFYLSLGLRVAGRAVFLVNAEGCQGVFEGVPAALPPENRVV
jgi:hypothetical protein